VSQCGANLQALIKKHNDPHASVASFGASEVVMDRLPAEQVENICQQAKIVPASLLSEEDTIGGRERAVHGPRNDLRQTSRR